MPSRSGKTDHSLLTCVPSSHRQPDLPVRKTDLAERSAPSTCRRDAAMCSIVSFTFRSLVSRHRHRKEYFAMTDYVLIHGAWHGSWCWARVRGLLAAGAHRGFTPTLTGVGERSHLLSRDVGLDTHIADVANLMIWENLRDVVLVGHSYSGFVARHVADRMPDRIRSLIYLDAFVPENGKTLFDYLPDNGEGDRKLAVAHGDGWRVPPRPASFFAVNAADAPWVDSQCTMHPLSSF